MYYLIHTSHSPRPYVSTISFIANDFASWGHRVTRHTANSAYITEVRYQEKRHRPAARRIELMEIWAKEVLARRQQPQTQETQASSSPHETRNSRASAFAQDFVACLSAFGTSPTPNPPSGFSLLTRCTQRIPLRSPQTPPKRPPPPPPLPPRPRRPLHPPPAAPLPHHLRHAALLDRPRDPHGRPDRAGLPVRAGGEARAAYACAARGCWEGEGADGEGGVG